MPAKRGLEQRLTAKVGGVPVIVWAVGLLAVGYLVVKLRGGSSSSTASPAPTDTTTGANVDNTGSGTVLPATDTSSSGDVTAATQDTAAQVSNLNDSLLSQLQGFGSQVDALTQAVQSSPAFWPGSGDSGSGSLVPNSGASATQTPARAPAVGHPASTTASKANPIRYYTFKPGQAPKNRKQDEAPARGPRGTTLHFATGRGYYYA